MKFIGEPVEVFFGDRRGFEKRPECPNEFRWRGETHRVDKCLSEWRDYSRKGRAAHNMRPSHLEAAEKRGSRGVGRYFFQVRTAAGRIFDLYFDRAPKDTTDAKGSWHLLREL